MERNLNSIAQVPEATPVQVQYTSEFLSARQGRKSMSLTKAILCIIRESIPLSTLLKFSHSTRRVQFVSHSSQLINHTMPEHQAHNKVRKHLDLVIGQEKLLFKCMHEGGSWDQIAEIYNNRYQTERRPEEIEARRTVLAAERTAMLR